MNSATCSNYDWLFNELPLDAKSVAFRRVIRDGEFWYQIHLAAPFGVGNAAALNDGIEGWVFGGLVEPVNEASLVTVAVDDAEILDAPMGQRTTAGPPDDIPPSAPKRIGHAWSGQVFSVVATEERIGACVMGSASSNREIHTWYQVFVGNLRLATGAVQKGWICDDFAILSE